MLRTFALWAIILASALSISGRIATAQDDNKSGGDESKPAEHKNGQPSTPGGAEKPVQPYRVEFLITELEDGKKVNSRHYTMLLSAGFNWNQIRIGTRVPEGPDNPGQFLDVGTMISGRVVERGSDVELGVTSDFSNFFSASSQDHIAKPIVRQISINGSTLVTNGKPVIVGVVDDPNSDRQFQLEATVTKLR